IVLGGCGLFTKTDLETGNQSELLQPQSVGQMGQTIDDLFAEVARRVPAFGGMFFDRDDNSVLYVYLLNPAQKAAVEAAITAVLGPSLPDLLPPREVRVLQGQYSFRQLKQWHDRMMALFALSGVLMTDIDDGNNRLVVGVESLEIRDTVEQELDKLGIPREAVLIKETSPVVPTSDTLNGYYRPLIGGLQIGPQVGGECTMGFNARRSGVEGFVMNSHCTPTMGQVDNMTYYQPNCCISNWIVGTEAVDPSPFTGGNCPSGERCRRSDSAFVRFNTGVQFNRGYIARPPSLGSKEIVGRFRIIYATGAVVPGLLLNKVGKATGWTRGVVPSQEEGGVCQNLRSGGILLLCQHAVERLSSDNVTLVDYGDSGSPVFMIRNQPNQYDVWLYGVLWGKSTTGIPRFYFSDIGQVRADLGYIYVCAAGFSC
ncbi:MAG: hypothetical protein QW360_01735, partial [Thermofilum sp.]